MRIALASIITLAGCADVAQPFELDHARVMAVRIDPPSLAPGDRAGLAVLVTDATGGPRVADAGTLEVTAPIDGIVERGAQGWEVVAPSREQLAVARTQLGLAADADVIAALAIEVILDGAPYAAQKTVAFGRRADNPAAPMILHDGATGPCIVEATTEVALAVSAAGDELSYRWFSSVGDLTGYTRAEATLEPARGTTGAIGVVVRDQAGGTAWAFEEAEVAP